MKGIQRRLKEARRGAQLICSDLLQNWLAGRAAQGITKRIVVGAGSWIGADTIIMPGVTIGKGVVIGTGSLVTTDLEDNAIYFGRPARLYKKL